MPLFVGGEEVFGVVDVDVRTSARSAILELAEKLLAFSCKKRGFCLSCGARRMAETAALLTDEILPERPLRQWVLSLPIALRFLLATDPDALRLVLGAAYRIISLALPATLVPSR